MRVQDGDKHIFVIANEPGDNEEDQGATDALKERAHRVRSRTAHNNALFMGSIVGNRTTEKTDEGK